MTTIATNTQLDAAPVLASIDTLLIEELSEDEDEAFAAALDSCGADAPLLKAETSSRAHSD